MFRSITSADDLAALQKEIDALRDRFVNRPDPMCKPAKARFERWVRVLPTRLASQQANHETRCAIVAALRAGATQKDIAAKTGLTPARISQIWLKHMRGLERPSPLERFFSETGLSMQWLAFRRPRPSAAPHQY